MKTNIVLIGMPASGKSTLGRELAAKMGMDFVDTDDLIEESAGKKLQEIIDSEGNEFFWTLEEKILGELTLVNHVIATGGSAILFPKAMENLRSIGTVVYLKQPLRNIEERLHNLSSRGVTLDEGETIADLYARRTPFYEKESEAVLECDGMTVEEGVEELRRRFANNR